MFSRSPFDDHCLLVSIINNITNNTTKINKTTDNCDDRQNNDNLKYHQRRRQTETILGTKSLPQAPQSLCTTATYSNESLIPPLSASSLASSLSTSSSIYSLSSLKSLSSSSTSSFSSINTTADQSSAITTTAATPPKMDLIYFGVMALIAIYFFFNDRFGAVVTRFWPWTGSTLRPISLQADNRDDYSMIIIKQRFNLLYRLVHRQFESILRARTTDNKYSSSSKVVDTNECNAENSEFANTLDTLSSAKYHTEKNEKENILHINKTTSDKSGVNIYEIDTLLAYLDSNNNKQNLDDGDESQRPLTPKRDDEHIIDFLDLLQQQTGAENVSIDRRLAVKILEIALIHFGASNRAPPSNANAIAQDRDRTDSLISATSAKSYASVDEGPENENKVKYEEEGEEEANYTNDDDRPIRRSYSTSFKTTISKLDNKLDTILDEIRVINERISRLEVASRTKSKDTNSNINDIVCAATLQIDDTEDDGVGSSLS